MALLKSNNLDRPAGNPWKSIDLPETKYYQNRFKYQTFENGFINNSVLLIQHDDLDVFEIDLK